MRIEQLRYFLDVCETRSINESARRLYISQPALTKSIQSMEKELGLVLFERLKSGIYLNKQGEIFLQYVKKILLEYEQARMALSQSLAFSAPINICICSTLATFFLPTILHEMKEWFPQLPININELSDNNLSFMMTYPRNSIALVIENGAYSPIIEWQEGFGIDQIAEDNVAVYCSASSRYANLKNLPFDLLETDRIQQVYLRSYDNYLSDRVSISNNYTTIRNLILDQNYLFFMTEKIGKKIFCNEPNIISIPIDKPESARYIMIISEKLKEEFVPIAHFLKQLLLQFLA